MPYEGEFASKSSHADIVQNPDVKAFLEQTSYIREPSQKEIERLRGCFQLAPEVGPEGMPADIFAIDGSPYESLIDERMPSTKVCYIKVSTIHIALDEFGALRVEDGRFVDPFRVARLRRNKDALLFVLPGANMKYKGYETVREGFRARVDEELRKAATRFDKSDHKTSLRSTLFFLASLRPDNMGTKDPERIILHQCPSCRHPGIELGDIEESQYCPKCGAEVYPSDVLRLWEEVTDFQSNQVAMSRFMMAVEHMLPVHYLRYLIDSNIELDTLARVAFFLDGPLAIFGNCAWLSKPLMRYYSSINQRLRDAGFCDLTILGLQKTGQLADYFGLIGKHIPNNTVFPVDDAYRYKYVIASREPSKTGFGDETYYGQDFLFKTESGRRFVVAIPYPFSEKGKTQARGFHELKTDVSRYPGLARTLELIRNFETDLYTNAVIPVALAHRYTAISAMPGGKVLDLLSKGLFGGP